MHGLDHDFIITITALGVPKSSSSSGIVISLYWLRLGAFAVELCCQNTVTCLLTILCVKKYNIIMCDVTDRALAV